MKVVTLLNTKGGVGKSTSSINIARGLQLRGYSAVIIDTDIDQNSCVLWRNGADPSFPPVVSSRPEDIKDTLKQCGDFDWVIIDGAGKVELSVIKIMVESDLIVIPVQPSPLDLWPSAEILETVTSLKYAPPVAYMLCRAKKGTNVKEIARNTLSSLGPVVFDGAIHEKVDYPQAIASGLTIYELNNAGAIEYSHIIDQIEDMLK